MTVRKSGRDGGNSEWPETRPVLIPNDAHLPLAGQRSGHGLMSIIPFLARTLKAKPRVPDLPDAEALPSASLPPTKPAK